ncbi:MAG: RecQ family ATP-dependent DNA helicase [Bacillota bacterium]|nr:RecQ family ATP-dependent DNA helicase [Bacillota bacterium]
MGNLIFIDTEVSADTGSIKDFGAINNKGEKLHTGREDLFLEFIKEASYLCGHNIIKHDLKYISISDKSILKIPAIDTLNLSPLLFPKKPYHKLVKDDKLHTDQINNPLNDSIQAKNLFYDQVSAYHRLDDDIKKIFYLLLKNTREFQGFFKFIKYEKDSVSLSNLIKEKFKGMICENVDMQGLIDKSPVELGYCLAIIHADDESSVTPRWVLRTYPDVERILYILRNNKCITGCVYCDRAFDPLLGLREFFGYDRYRVFDGEPLQEKAVTAAVNSKSLLAIFPTGGGKSITFQIPALMAGKTTGGLTVIISPLQSLMKDQVDNLEKVGITEGVTINGLLDPIERADALERVEDGSAKILYISPESLRSRTIERLLLGRKIERFVIDEAHCFSAWGHDFRVDYLYIADFIKNLYEKKQLDIMIPVSCFTATAKQNVIEDIRNHFKEKLNIDLEVFKASSARKNLHYKVIQCTKENKYDNLRQLIAGKDCPTIVYVTRTRRAEELAERLNNDGYRAKPYHGRMDTNIKSENQDLFTRGEVDIMVATSAFGMGVDKSDVGFVIHYNISSSLENYVQEAGRAGRDQNIEADCYVLFDDEDLNGHFSMLNQTKLNISEIGQIWKAIKDITRNRNKVSQSALEIARKAGWDDSVMDIETRVKTAVSAIEQAGYIQRGQNMPRVYADSILAESVKEAAERIRNSEKFEGKDEENAVRIIAKLIGARSRKANNQDEAESRIDYISDQLGIIKEDVIRLVNLMKEEKLLADSKDLSAYVYDDMTQLKAINQLKQHRDLEDFLLRTIEGDGIINIKELNEAAENAGLKKVSTDKVITILNYWNIKKYIKKETRRRSKNHIKLTFLESHEELRKRFNKRMMIGDFIIEYLYEKSQVDDIVVEFSELELIEAFAFENRLLQLEATQKEIEDALLYLTKIDSLKIEGGFLVLYNALTIERLELNNMIKYKKEDYKQLKSFYEQKAHQIHIVGEYAKKMLEDYNAAINFVDDYFTLNYETFLKKYFKGSKGDEIKRSITNKKFRQLFGELSPSQLRIINDQDTKYIVVAAGPGSGKTRILVHKLASLLLMEDVRHEHLLMVTFSRAAATEFKRRLKYLIGKSVNYVDIKTFHSYCFDLLGRVGDIEKSENIVCETAKLITEGEVEKSRITKTVMVVDEAQDMDVNEIEFIRAMIRKNEDMRVIAVGDDDQNIYEFRGSSSKYMKGIAEARGAKMYELVENYRSRANLVEFTNGYVQKLSNRMKTTPIMPNKNKDGKIELIYYHHDNIMDGVLKKLQDEGAKGSICLMTATNDEALQMTGGLLDAGYNAKLIQSNEYVNLKGLDEIRYFIEELNLIPEVHKVDLETWNNAKNKLYKEYKGSENIDMCKRLFKDFELTAGGDIYVSDFTIFLRESKMEDFLYYGQEVIQVSTMHKSKGREFDTVIILLDKYVDDNDEKRRTLYVAMTRAKEALQIHYRDRRYNGVFNYAKGNGAVNEGINNVKFYQVKNSSRTKSKLVYQLRYKDIFLSYYYNDSVKRYIHGLKSGDMLDVKESGCFNSKGQQVVFFSKSFKEEIKNQLDKGFVFRDARVNMVVYWKSEDEEEEVKIVMPTLRLEENEE